MTKELFIATYSVNPKENGLLIETMPEIRCKAVYAESYDKAREMIDRYLSSMTNGLASYSLENIESPLHD